MLALCLSLILLRCRQASSWASTRLPGPPAHPALPLAWVRMRRQAGCWESARLPVPPPDTVSASGLGAHALSPHLVILRVWLKEAVLLDGHGWRQRYGVSALLAFFFSAALHARGRGFGQCTTAETLVPSSLKSNSDCYCWLVLDHDGQAPLMG